MSTDYILSLRRVESALKPVDSYEAINSEESAVILPEDHPLLERFQNSLNAHLRRVSDQIITEINELKFEINKKEHERENLGCKLYGCQQQIRQQHPILQQYEKEIHQTTEKRMESEKEAEEFMKKHDQKLLLYKNGKGYHNQRLLELNSLQVLEGNIENWANEVKREVQVAKRAVNKDGQNQKAVSEEKKRADLLLLALFNEIRRRELELNTIKSQIREQVCALETVSKHLSTATTDLEALHQEQKRLTQTWSEVILAIQQRDNLLLQLKKKLVRKINDCKLIYDHFEATKKETLEEMEMNEKLINVKSKAEEAIQKIRKQIQKKLELLAKYQENLAKFRQLFDQTQKDFNASTAEGNSLLIKLRSVQHHMDNIIRKRIDTEEQILLKAQEQITTDKASEYRMKRVREVQQQRRAMEINLTQSDSSLSNALFELERIRGAIGYSKEHSLKINQEYELAQLENAKLKDEIKGIKFSANVKIKHIDHIVKKNAYLTQVQGNVECSLHVKINCLERNITETEQQIGILQNYWLHLQGSVVQLSEKRLVQLDDMQLVRNQVSVIEQKTLRIDRELDNSNLLATETTRSIKNINTKLNLLGTKLFKKRQSREKGALDTYQIHLELLDRYRTSEISLLTSEREIINLTNEIGYWKDEDIKVHREALSWESKYKIVEEVIKIRNEEKNSDCEFDSMRTEIHRMEIRYNQLKRAQCKLTQDLEHCVLHREQIFVQALHRERTQGGLEQLRPNIQHKLNEIKNKIKQSQSELTHNELILADIKDNNSKLSISTAHLQDEIENEKLQDTLTQTEIEQSILLKHKNLENIIRKQHRGKGYRGLVAMTNFPRWRSEITTDSNKTKQNVINSKLSDIILNLLNDFPDKNFFLLRILQTLGEHE